MIAYPLPEKLFSSPLTDPEGGDDGPGGDGPHPQGDAGAEETGGGNQGQVRRTYAQ